MTYGPSNTDASYYLPQIAAIGANTVRTWGTDSTDTADLLNAADANGVKVIMGFWRQPIRGLHQRYERTRRMI